MKKSTGIVRRVDELGRIVIPVEIRERLEIKEKDPIEISMNGTSIVLEKFKTVLCRNCCLRVEEGDKFCKHCGVELC